MGKGYFPEIWITWIFLVTKIDQHLPELVVIEWAKNWWLLKFPNVGIQFSHHLALSPNNIAKMMWKLNTSIHSTETLQNATAKDSAGVKFFTMWGSSLDFLNITAFQVVSQLIIIIWVDAEILNFSGTELGTSIDIVYVGWFVSPQSSFLLISNFCGLENWAFGKRHPCRYLDPKGDGSECNARKKIDYDYPLLSPLSLSLFFEWLVLLCEFHWVNWVLDSQAWHMVHEIMRSPQFQAGFFTISSHSKRQLPSLPCRRKWSNGSWLPPLTRFLRPALPVAGGPVPSPLRGERSSHWRPRF